MHTAAFRVGSSLVCVMNELQCLTTICEHQGKFAWEQTSYHAWSCMSILFITFLRMEANCTVNSTAQLVTTSCPLLSWGGGFPASGKLQNVTSHTFGNMIYEYISYIYRSLFKCHGKDEPRGVSGRGHLRDELLCDHGQPRWGRLLGAHPITGELAEQCEDHHDVEPRQRFAAWRRHRAKQEVLHWEFKALIQYKMHYDNLCNRWALPLRTLLKVVPARFQA